MHAIYSQTQNNTYTKINLSTVKWAQWDKTQSWELLGLFICVCSSLCTIVAHNTAQNRPDNYPSCSPDNHHRSDTFLHLKHTQKWSAVKDIVFIAQRKHANNKYKRTAWIDTATTMPPHWWYSAGKLSNPAPKPAFTTRNTDAYHEVPASVKNMNHFSHYHAKWLAVWLTAQ